MSAVNNARVKPLIDEMSAAGRGAKAITTAFQVIRAVVSFPKDESTRKPLHMVNWDKDYLDIPIITYSRQPAFTLEGITKIINEAIGQFQVLYALLAGTGLRVGEIFALEIN